MNPGIQAVLREVATAGIVSLFDPKPITWSGQHERDLRRIRPVIERATAETSTEFKKPENRNSFLLACLDLTEHEPVEHLIVGYGIRHGSTTRVASVHHAIGSQHQVQPSGTMARTMLGHGSTAPKNELVVFHNHPHNVINLLVDNVPLASNKDRKTLEDLALNLVQMCRLLSGAGRILFYLGENGFVREIRWPRLETILNLASLAQRG